MNAQRTPSLRGQALIWAIAISSLCAVGAVALAADPAENEPGIIEPVTSELNARAGMDDPVVRIPHTDQSVDGVEQTNLHGAVNYFDGFGATSMMGHPITSMNSPHADMRTALDTMSQAVRSNDRAALEAASDELSAILHGTTSGRLYDGFSMLNYNRGAYLPDHIEGEYKMKWAVDSGETFVSPFDGETRKIWEMDINMLFYDGQIDSDTFMVRFPVDAHDDDTLRVHYRIYSLVLEDFSPTLVMLDKRVALNTVQFPFKGFDSVWVAFNPGQIIDMSIDYPPVRMLRGVYTWGWRQHPPRIQFLQPVYEITNVHTGEVELDPQGRSYAYRNRTNLTLDAISEAAPEKKMMRLVEAVENGASMATLDDWLNDANQGPAGTWIDWVDLAETQTQLPNEAWDMLAQEGLSPGQFGDYDMISVFMNNEMYGNGPWLNEVNGWAQGDDFKVKLINLDRHTHYFRNVDFGTRLHDDILRCCGGGETSFEIMNFKPSYGAPKVAEMQWRAGWGFRPHYDVIQQDGVFSRTSDRVQLKPYTGGLGGTHFGYQYSESKRGGDFRFSPPPFVITDHDHPAPFPLRDADGEAGLVIGQFTEGYGTQQMCSGDDYPGFCQTDFGPANPYGVLNWPSPNDPTVPKTELRFPPFLRNPSQGVEGAGDIIPPTGAWRPFLWVNPYNNTLFVDPDDPSKGYWADLTYGHGRPIYAGEAITAEIELPRASGQVFYQFDDLFHDNAIFSPHPLFEGTEELDEVSGLRAFLRRGSLKVRGKVSELPGGERAEWVSVFSGSAGVSGCTGELLGVASVQGSRGRFAFSKAAVGIIPGERVCVQSTVGAFADVAAEQ